jgi:hypothetical protein
MKTAADIFHQNCTLVNKDWNEYIIKDKKKFIADIESYASERLRGELIDFLTYYQSLWECEKVGRLNSGIIDDYLETKNRTELKSKQ